MQIKDEVKITRERVVKVKVNGRFIDINELGISEMTREMLRENITEIATCCPDLALVLSRQITSDQK
jgi:hypothetical protein